MRHKHVSWRGSAADGGQRPLYRQRLNNSCRKVGAPDIQPGGGHGGGSRGGRSVGGVSHCCGGRRVCGRRLAYADGVTTFAGAGNVWAHVRGEVISCSEFTD